MQRRNTNLGNLERIDGIARGSMLPADELAQLLGSFTDEDLEYASTLARAVSERVFGKTVYIRGRITASTAASAATTETPAATD